MKHLPAICRWVTKKIKRETVVKVSSVFSSFSLGVATNRDAWVYNFSKENLARNMRGMIAFYNSEVSRYQNFGSVKEKVRFRLLIMIQLKLNGLARYETI